MNRSTVKAVAVAPLALGPVSLSAQSRSPLFGSLSPGAQEARLNQVAYSLLRSDRRPDAIVVFRKIVEVHPGSSNAHDSLAEALEAAGDKAEAILVTRKGLEVLEREHLPEARRQQVRDALDGRLRQLAP